MASKVVPTGASHFLPEGVLFGAHPSISLPFHFTGGQLQA